MKGRFERSTLVLVLISAVLLSFLMYNQLFRKSLVPSASAVLTGGNIGVYWDVNCTQTVTSIDWGNLTPGATEEVAVYVRNEGNQTLALSLTPLNWNPANASQYLTFSWNYLNSVIEAGKVLTVKQTLNVASPRAGGFSSCTFDTLFESLDHLLADVNKDGVVDVIDLAILGKHYQETLSSPGWNPDLDLNKDGKVNIEDISLAARYFDAQWPAD
jgi:hypothetical protein